MKTEIELHPTLSGQDIADLVKIRRDALHELSNNFLAALAAARAANFEVHKARRALIDFLKRLVYLEEDHARFQIGTKIFEVNAVDVVLHDVLDLERDLHETQI